MTAFKKAKTFVSDIMQHKERPLMPRDVADAREFIKSYWPHLIRSHSKDNGSLIGLPYPYLVPSYAEDHEFDYDELFYWDSYFMVQALWDDEHKALIIGILDDLIFLFKRFKIIPNSSQYYMTGRSQPPFLTSLILDIANHYNMGNAWTAERLEVAKEEYATVWMGERKPNDRKVYHGLSRYFDYNYLDDIAETESGWDMTPRFNHHALNYLPVDLNALLYKYETDFARFAHASGNANEAAKWFALADKRKDTMNELMWDKSKGLYFDYDYVRAKRGSIVSLASYYPMWVGMVSDKQAEQLVRSLGRFLNVGGLSTTDSLPVSQIVLGSGPTQWAYPNGWAPLHFLVVEALERYGYQKEARMIATRWLKTNLHWFNKHHVFLEKYNVVSPEKPPQKGLYPSQVGFGWTNAVFERFCQDYIDRPL